MAKEKPETNDKKVETCTSIFKNEFLTREDYTDIWMDLISALERRKSVNFSPKS